MSALLLSLLVRVLASRVDHCTHCGRALPWCICDWLEGQK